MLYALVFLSGAAALVYEVVWSRQLATFLGITAWAHSAVIASFMLGLALGGWLLGRAADRARRPLALFAALEGAIGLYGAAALVLVPAIESIYLEAAAGLAPDGGGARALRFLLAGTVLLLPTVAMGGTLPVVVRVLAAGAGPVGSPVGRVYGANTLGAAAGALAAAYALLPALGARAAIAVAVAANAAVALAALALARRAPGSGRAEPASAPGAASGAGGRALAALAVAGFAALAAEIVWVRALTLVIGSSVYALGLTLATYLLGIALGSLACGRWRQGRAAAIGPRHAAAAALAAAWAVALGLAALGRLPGLFLDGFRGGLHLDFLSLQLLDGALAALVILAPTLAMGALFPLLVELATGRPSSLGGDVGAAAAANSLGTVAGALAGGLALLPALGVAGSLRLLALVYAVLAAALWLADRPRRVWAAAAAPASVGLLLLFMPGWDPVLMTAGVFLNAPRIVDVPVGESFRDWLRERNRVLFYRDGVEATVSVRDVGEERLLVINGKTDGSRFGDRRTQLALAYLPLAMVAAPRRAFVVGYGTGMTVAALATAQSLESITVAEISRDVVAAARWFEVENRNVRFDPRLDLVYADARNALALTGQRYDLLVSEPSNPWLSGVANLYTREFFDLAASRLAPDGLMVQWFQTYGLSRRDLASVLATFASVFSDVSVWMPQLGDLVLIGSATPHALDPAAFEAVRTAPLARLDLTAVGLERLDDLARLFLAGAAEVEALAEGAALNTDDRPRLEFGAPRALYRETTLDNVRALIDAGGGGGRRVPVEPLGSFAAGRYRVFGLAIAARSPAEVEAEWLVAWSSPRVVHGSVPEPVAVGSHRSLRLATTGGPFELAITGADPAAAIDLERRLAELAPGPPERAGFALLADGTEAAWLAGSGGEPFAGLAWRCGELLYRGFRRGAAGLGGLAGRFACDDGSAPPPAAARSTSQAPGTSASTTRRARLSQRPQRSSMALSALATTSCDSARVRSTWRASSTRHAGSRPSTVASMSRRSRPLFDTGWSR